MIPGKRSTEPVGADLGENRVRMLVDKPFLVPIHRVVLGVQEACPQTRHYSYSAAVPGLV